jgi:hypothetical protein
MRTIAVVVMVGTCTVAQAKPGTLSKLAVVDDEPVSHQAAEAKPERDLLGSGSRREILVRTPEVTHTNDVGPAPVERTVTESAPRALNDAAMSGAVDELVARQMRRYQAAIDACATDAVRRNPSAHGTVALAVTVAERKVTELHVVDDTVRDFDLDACLVKVGHAWKFALRSATFTWPVVLASAAPSSPPAAQR